MKKIDVLKWGIEHIAQNHNFNANVEDIYDGEVCIYGGCNVPTVADVKMMCVDLGITYDCISVSEYGIEIFLTDEWYNSASEEYVETGCEMWKRYGVKIA